MQVHLDCTIYSCYLHSLNLTNVENLFLNMLTVQKQGRM